MKSSGENISLLPSLPSFQSWSHPTRAPPAAAPSNLSSFNRFQGLYQSDGGRTSSDGPNKPSSVRLLPHHRESPIGSNASSRENSRPVSPVRSKEPSRSGTPTPAVTAALDETVKNIFNEYFSVRKFEDTLHWIKSRFPGMLYLSCVVLPVPVVVL